MDCGKLYRAALTMTYPDGDVRTYYRGPYKRPGMAKSMVTREKHGWRAAAPATLDGHIEVTDVSWSRYAE